MRTIAIEERRAAVAGRFYPGQANQLERLVRSLVETTTYQGLRGVRGLVSPHAGYTCSGTIAGAAFRALHHLPPAPRVVYLMGPAHWKPVGGVGLSSAGAFATPLGSVPVAVERVAGLLSLGTPYRLDDEAHAPEHCLEVELPFLQVMLGDFQIVPMLFDEAAAPERIAGDLLPLLAAHPQDMIVVSSDLSHYRPYQDAVNVDHALLKALATGDRPAVNCGEACGLLPILTLMHIAEVRRWTPHLLAYANSGDTCGSHREVVGYGAVAYTERA
jgi:MEMO1 family protein